MARILLIDDDESVRTVVRLTLEQAGHAVLEASDGNKGLALKNREQVDLVLTDLIMPDKEGLETIMTIRKTDPKMKIIAMSGGGRGAGDCYLQMASRMGADEVLPKPFHSRDLLEAIGRVLGE